MNRTLLSRDSGNRAGDPHRPSRFGRAVPSAFRLARRDQHPPERETPPGGSPAARHGRNCDRSGLDRIAALAVLAFRRRHGQAHLLADGPGQEATDRMRLPAGGLHQLFGCDASRSLQQFQNAVRFAALARTGAFLGLRTFLGLGRFLSRTGLLPRLAFFGATWARRAPALAFFFAFGSSAWTTVTASVVSLSDVMLFLLLWELCHDIAHSGAERLQDNSSNRHRRRWNGNRRQRTSEIAWRRRWLIVGS